MTQVPSIRLRPTDPDFLDTQAFDSGSVFYDSAKNTLVLMDGRTRGGYELLRADLTNATTGLGVEVSSTPPTNARAGSLWLDTQSGELLIYLDDGDSQQWIQPSAPSFSVSSGGSNIGATALTDLTDVNIVGVTDGQVLKYSTAQGKWIAASDLTAAGGAGISLSDLSVSVATPSGSGNLSYDNTTGIFTFTPPSFSISAIGFAQGVIINEFSSDATMADNSTEAVPVESAVRGYVNRRLGFDHDGIPVSGILKIGPGVAVNSFTTIAVSGQSDIVADSSIDTLTLVAGTGISITTDATTDTLTISASGTGGATALTDLTDINVTGVTDGQVLKYSTAQSKWIAASDLTATGGAGISLSDLSVSVVTASGGGSLTYNNTSGVFTFAPAVIGVTSVGGTGTVNGITLTGTVTSTGNLTLGGTLGNVSLTSQVTGTLPVLNGGTGTTTPSLVAGTNVTITGTWPNQTVNSTASGVTTFAALTDNAGLTVDKIYLPAITMLNVTASGTSAYLFDQYSGNNPTIYAISGTTIAFDLSVGLGSHPFLIRTSGGVNYNIGLTHITSAGVVTTEASAQGKTSGTLYWKIPAGTTGNYQYICQNHGTMVGVITIKDIATI